MATATRCARCGTPGEDTDCPACETGLDLANLFRRSEELFGREEQVPDLAASADPGNHFGDFIRIELLGNGGMGEVWKAWDRKLRRWVALKFPKCEGESDLDRLQEEATSAGILSHPNVATVYGFGRANGHHFIAMQYIDGMTLAEYPRADRRKLIAFVRYAAMGVACAHSHGIIHRDLKPENIMVEREREQIYVTDFGIARHAAAGRNATSVIGTPPYMSPEQARGAGVDARSDVYSLTATLYELLADRPPFVGASPADTLHRVLTEEPRPLQHLDADLNAILMKGLDKAPAERYSTVLEFAEDLNRYLRDEPVRARRSNVARRLCKGAARHRAAAIAAAAGLAATLFVTSLLVAGRSEERIRREAEERELVRREDERRVQRRRLLEAEEGKRSDLRELLVLWSRVVLAKQGWYQPRKNPQATRREIESAVSGLNAYVARNPDQLQGYYVRARGRLYLDNLEGARSDLEKAIAIEPEFGPGWALLGRVKGEQFFRNLISDSQEMLTGFREATPLLQEANVAFERSRRKASPAGAPAAWGLESMEDEQIAEVLARAMALAYVDRNLPAARRLLEESHRASPSEEYCNLLGGWAGDDSANIAWQTEALSIRPHYSLAYFDRGSAKSRQGDRSGALEDYSKAIDANPRFLPARFGRAQLYLTAFDDPKRALEDFAQVLKIHSQIAPAYLGRARARVLLGDPAGALDELKAALALTPQDPVLHAAGAEIRVLLKDWRGAVADASEALRLSPRDPVASSHRAAARLGSGDVRGAIDDSTCALLGDSRLVSAYCVRASARNRSGDPEGASQDAAAAILIDVRSAPAYTQRAIALLKLGDAKAAVRDATDALTLDPRSPQAHAVRAAARIRLEDLDGAAADASQAIALDPRDADAYANRAAVHDRKGDALQSVADATEALALDPKLVAARLVRAAARVRLFDYEGAIDDCTQVLKEDPRHSKAYVSRGIAKERKGDVRGAIEDSTLAFMLDPRSAEAVSNRSAAKALLQDDEGAIQDATQALTIDPRHVAAYLNRAAARARKGELSGAIEDCTAALALRPDDVGLSFKRGSLLLDLGKAGKRPQPKLLLQARADFSRVLEVQGPFRSKAEARMKEIQSALAGG